MIQAERDRVRMEMNDQALAARIHQREKEKAAIRRQEREVAKERKALQRQQSAQAGEAGMKNVRMESNGALLDLLYTDFPTHGIAGHNFITFNVVFFCSQSARKFRRVFATCEWATTTTRTSQLHLSVCHYFAPLKQSKVR